jgi:transposase
MTTSTPAAIIVGADISSTEIVLAFVNTTQAVKSIANSRKAIELWLSHLPAGTIIGMEATGRYHEALADLATAGGFCVYVINPKHLSSYARGVAQRGKTDPQDAAVIARYVERERDKLRPYTVPTTSQRALRNLLSQRAAIVKHTTAMRLSLRETGLSECATLQRAYQEAMQCLTNLIHQIEAQLKITMRQDAALEKKRIALQSIVGIGLLNSLALAHRFDRTPFANSDAVVAAYGLDPRPKDSGNKAGRRYLTKEGNAEDRRLIYLAAQSATKTKVFRPLYWKLREKRFATTEAIVIIARKLLRIAFAVWTTGKPFDPTKLAFYACAKP